jgi:hypothetical protein
VTFREGIIEKQEPCDTLLETTEIVTDDTRALARRKLAEDLRSAMWRADHQLDPRIRTAGKYDTTIVIRTGCSATYSEILRRLDRLEPSLKLKLKDAGFDAMVIEMQFDNEGYKIAL